MKNLFISCLAISAFIYSCTGECNSEPICPSDTTGVVDTLCMDTTHVDTTKH